MKRKSFSTYVDVEVELEYYDLIELLEDYFIDCSEEEQIALKKYIKGKHIYKNVNDVDAEVDVDFNDILSMIETCDINEKNDIRNLIGNTNQFECESLYDEQKLKVLKAAFDKYDLDQLIEKLNIKEY